MTLLKSRLRATPARKLYFLPSRTKLAFSYYSKPLREIACWLTFSNEHTNFGYDLDPVNQEYLAAFLAHVTSKPLPLLRGYLDEILGDEGLREHVRRITLELGENYAADSDAKYARRIGWYALIRAIKPRVVVETGVEKGLGSCVIAAALMRNSKEGFRGQAFGTDINPRAGFLLREPYSEYSKLLIGDSIESLSRMEGPIDLFINDSDHSAEYEAREYETIKDKLAPGAFILGDNAHVTDSLLRFAEQTGRSFLYFQEKPKGHWYPGAGIGVAFERGRGENA